MEKTVRRNIMTIYGDWRIFRKHYQESGLGQRLYLVAIWLFWLQLESIASKSGGRQMVAVGTVQQPQATTEDVVLQQILLLQCKKKPTATNTWLQEQILQRLDWLPKVLQPRNTWLQYFMIATNESVAIEKYCHSKITWPYGHITAKCDPLHQSAFATYQIWLRQMIW